MQRNWIGRSEGALVRFATDHGDLEVFTTRPDTLFGATYMVVAPEHPLVDVADRRRSGRTAPRTRGEVQPDRRRLARTPAEAIAAYRAAAAPKTEVERQTERRDKTGVFTGAFATNPVNGEQIPVFVADYVLMGYGTGAIMAVPGQDERDWEFAERFDLPIVRTVAPPDDFDGEAFTGDGPAINSANDEISLERPGGGRGQGSHHRLAGAEGHWRRHHHLQAARLAVQPAALLGRAVPDRLRRRRRRGPAHALPDAALPVELPEVDDYSPQAARPERRRLRAGAAAGARGRLGRGHARPGRRAAPLPPRDEHDAPVGRLVLVRAALPRPDQRRGVRRPRGRAVLDGSARAAGDAGGVDLYVGGVEHAVLHLLYARFWHKVLFDLGHVSSEEPFRRLFNQGYIQAYAYTDERGIYVPAAEVVEAPDGPTASPTTATPVTQRVREDGQVPEERRDARRDVRGVRRRHPARLRDVHGPARRVAAVGDPGRRRAFSASCSGSGATSSTRRRATCVVVDVPMDDATCRVLHRTIDAVRADMDALRLNTAIARLIELNNHLTRLDAVPRDAAEALVLMLAPLAPHIAEELWSTARAPGVAGRRALPGRRPRDAAGGDRHLRRPGRRARSATGSRCPCRSARTTCASGRWRARSCSVRSPSGRSARVVVRAPKLVNVVPA